VGTGGLTTETVTAFEVIPRQVTVTGRLPAEVRSDAAAVVLISVEPKSAEGTGLPLI
jgi:hypothetical protein